MKKEFVHRNFLLKTKRAETLYHDYAETMPIIDYHCHLSPKEIAENRQFQNLTQVWLYGDHYKWRAMRTSGVNERFVTGDAGDWEKFQKWAETVPKTLQESPLPLDAHGIEAPVRNLRSFARRNDREEHLG